MTRRTNLALAALLVAAVVSGLVSQAVGTDWTLDPAVVHGVVALAILLLAPWKQAIIRRGMGVAEDRGGSRWPCWDWCSSPSPAGWCTPPGWCGGWGR